MAERRPIWSVPSLHREEELDRERRVTWLELFFDLFFVVAIAALSHDFAHELTWEGAGEFVLKFLPVWWIWIGATFYNERFESFGLENRLFAFLLFVPVVGLAVAAEDGLGDDFALFAGSYVLGRLIITALWLRATYHVREFRPTGGRFVAGFSVALVLSSTSILATGTARYVLFGLALAIDVTTPIATARHQARLPRFSTSKLPERFGLFTIIVLGETVVAVVTALRDVADVTPLLLLDAVLGVAVGFLLWWLYFDFVARRSPKPGIWWRLSWSYLHVPLVMSVVTVGAGMTNILGAEGVLGRPARITMGAATGIALVSLGLLESTLLARDDEPTHLTVSPAIKFATGLGAVGVAILPIAEASLLLAVEILLLGVSAFYGAWVWFHQPIGAASAVSHQG